MIRKPVLDLTIPVTIIVALIFMANGVSAPIVLLIALMFLLLNK